MIKEVNELKEEVADLKTENHELADYIQTLERNVALNCQGKTFQEVGKKQKERKLRLLKNKAQCALWFPKSFGLELSHITLLDKEGTNHTIDYDAPCTATGMSRDDEDMLEKILFLLDKFCISNEAYHELSMITDDLPKSYLIKRSRLDMNNTYSMERTQGKYPGAKLDFTSTLINHVKDLLVKKPELEGETIQVKLSGDGARMSRTTNFMMFSLVLLQLEENVMSSKNNRTVAIINGPEDYQTLKDSLPNFLREVNELINKGFIVIDDKEIQLEFFLGGDLKFLLMIMGLNSASSNYACLWCKVHKHNRWDTSKPLNYYNEGTQQRNLADLKKLCQTKGEKFGCIYPPLIDIELDHVVPDELHLFLRVTDRLLENVIDEIIEQASIADFNKPNTQPKGQLLKNFVENINELGVPFSVWYKKNSDGSSSNIPEHASLVGAQKRTLLNKLPGILHHYLYPETCEIVIQIWNDFKDYYDLIGNFKLTTDSPNIVFNRGIRWIELFCSLRNTRPGYTRARVTPYMHIMCYHIPTFIQQYGSIKKFTGNNNNNNYNNNNNNNK